MSRLVVLVAKAPSGPVAFTAAATTVTTPAVAQRFPWPCVAWCGRVVPFMLWSFVEHLRLTLPDPAWRGGSRPKRRAVRS